MERNGPAHVILDLLSSIFYPPSSLLFLALLASWRPWRRNRDLGDDPGRRSSVIVTTAQAAPPHKTAPTPLGPRRRPSARRKEAAKTLLLHVLLVGLAFVALVPFAWLVCACFKTQDDIFAYAFLPWDHLDSLTARNFPALFRREPYGLW